MVAKMKERRKREEVNFEKNLVDFICNRTTILCPIQYIKEGLWQKQNIHAKK